MSGDEKPKPKPLSRAQANPADEIEILHTRRPVGLPADSLLRGPDNYDGVGTAKWDQLDEFAISSISLSCHISVIHHVAEVDCHAAAWWNAFKQTFRPMDAQGSYRSLTRIWSLSLANASVEAFDPF
ncbi:uncharacterized protein JCM15063_002307 [Sporobolomyces koalae]|uniref:uncharacterized protein n=1 Tax=Sporobolomyces koalae TaxID=500713 RepID=UPI00317EAEA8